MELWDRLLVRQRLLEVRMHQVVEYQLVWKVYPRPALRA